MVPQSRKDRNYRIPDILAFQQPVAIQIANIDCTVSEPYVVAPEFVLHSKGRFSNVEQHLGAGIFRTTETLPGNIRPFEAASWHRCRSVVPGGRGPCLRFHREGLPECFEPPWTARHLATSPRRYRSTRAS